ncbi:MAG TPA: sulfotransferase [Solimonas sp.]
MKRPDLFVLGAPKCGTTLMARWLSACPEVFVSPVKEPHYFCEEHRWTPTLAAYEALFASADPETLWVAEASVWHLYSPSAVPAILDYAPTAKFIVMVRDPVSLIASMHEQHCFNGNELVTDLAEAVLLSDSRLEGGRDGIRDGYAPASHMAYFDCCALGKQLERLFRRVPRERVHVVVFDDLKADPQRVFDAVRAFLGLPAMLVPTLETVNGAKERRSPWLDRWVLRLARLKSALGVRGRLGILAVIRRHNVAYRKREPVPEALRVQIRERMREDVALLSRTLRRDLSTEWGFTEGASK